MSAPQALPPRRVGVFGGAFDPPHNAHRALAETAIRLLPLDRLHIVPTGQAWHKARVLSPTVHRVALCRLAFGDLPGVVIDTREIERPGPSYTVDTLSELRALYPQAQLFLLLGADQWAAFRTWRRWPDILSLATVAVAARPPTDGAPPAPATPDDLPCLRLPLPPMDLSATAVRATWLRDPAQAARLVPPAVARYISTHGLYQMPSGDDPPSSVHP
ncbi:nicotinate (nicotinamide) nucleotide adenylyltransferase [Tepidimonas charontis]|uniref:Probable nicotinate-nucleotide adenylyltransferase n=1 Tax=Tepidimonas charontis TaxID=2267262 RepID=A0A554XHR3_9BURK|nr:nicotinate (nicotinamide) nucleotide adenylyltransferase [Tepidimonas charontis]TSE35370.1 Nicotinate-nucleotide adenylyltransferase [Tepidimonas charontis]